MEAVPTAAGPILSPPGATLTKTSSGRSFGISIRRRNADEILIHKRLRLLRAISLVRRAPPGLQPGGLQPSHTGEAGLAVVERQKSRRLEDEGRSNVQ